MRIDGTVAVLALEREASLRVEPRTRVEITCLSGVLWVTQEGDSRDLFLAPGESFKLLPRGVTLVTALEAAAVRVLDSSVEPRSPRFGWTVAGRVFALWSGLAARRSAVIKPRAAVP
jgi:Protein of unknown function (DUF2917)